MTRTTIQSEDIKNPLDLEDAILQRPEVKDYAETVNAIGGTGGTGNPRNEYLHPNSTAKQNGPSDGGSFELVDFVSNGFKYRNTAPAYNSGTFIYIAFAEFPFKTGNAR